MDKHLQIQVARVRVRRSNSQKFEGADKFTGAVTYSVVGTFGDDRVRLSLGTDEWKVAAKRVESIKVACAAGMSSSTWLELSELLPRKTYEFFRSRLDHAAANVTIVNRNLREPQAGLLVYFIRAAESRRVKIGYSEDVQERLQALQTGSPEPLHLEVVVPASKFSERAPHERFVASRKHGEWFESTPSLEAFISSLKVRAA